MNEDPDNWVVIHFANNDDYMAMDAVDTLVDTEVAADEALQEAGAGFIDGNEVGDYSYDLYFVGEDPSAMWAIIGPVFEAAPMKWTSVELRHGLEDQSPTVISAGD
jgi:hypothetical protein